MAMFVVKPIVVQINGQVYGSINRFSWNISYMVVAEP